jgi:hypothetical protein
VARAERLVRPGQGPPPPRSSTLSAEDDRFLNDLEHANFLFFWEQANPDTGLIRDRCNVRTKDTGLAASIASVGFGLTAICIGLMRGFLSYEDARTRVLKTLVPVAQTPTHRGFYHFANMNTGDRVGFNLPVDTAMLPCGASPARSVFSGQGHRRPGACHFDRGGLDVAV